MRMTKAWAYIGLGANLGDPVRQMKVALDQFRRSESIQVAKVSSVYKSPPEGNLPGPDFFNAVAALHTTLSPRALWELGKALESAAGRLPGTRNAPRVLDLDLLLYEGCQCHEPDLEIPHPRMTQRAFVLVPLAEIGPEVWHSGVGKTAAELAQAVDRRGLEMVRAGSGWSAPTGAFKMMNP
jgi:2-amino-4-hydroxy-6-hydroxymethyldihydropteridine diphosphokinase